jgi:hypothetical protein
VGFGLVTGFIGHFYSFQSQRQSYVTTDGESASQSWCKAPIWAPKNQIFVSVRHLRVCSCGRPLWREDGPVVYNCYWFSPAQSFSGPSPARLMAMPYCFTLENPPTWRARSSYLYRPGTRWPVPPGTGCPFRRLLRITGLWWRYSNPTSSGEALASSAQSTHVVSSRTA